MPGYQLRMVFANDTRIALIKDTSSPRSLCERFKKMFEREDKDLSKSEYDKLMKMGNYSQHMVFTLVKDGQKTEIPPDYFSRLSPEGTKDSYLVEVTFQSQTGNQIKQESQQLDRLGCL